MGPGHLITCLVLLCCCVGVSLSSPSPPQAGQPDFRAKHLARNVPNPLLSSRQVRADDVRARASKRQSCPTPQVSGSCCPTGQTVCGSICTDLLTDAGHCGNCETTCESGSCNNGACCSTDEPTICGGVCTSLETDPLNCGSCGDVCGQYQICTGYQCLTCQYGSEVCSNTCTALLDPEHCGSCGHVCGNDQICAEIFGSYGCLTCSTGNQACGNECISLLDINNCGSCGHVCGNDQICFDFLGSYGCFTCSSGYQSCGNECVLLTDSGNCGTCGNDCPSGQDCFALPGGPGVSPSYICNSPTAQCQGVIQVWGNGGFYGYLRSVGYDGTSQATAGAIYTWDTVGTPFSIECGGGTRLDLTSLNPIDTTYVHACAAEGSGTIGTTALVMTGCQTETSPGSEPMADATEVVDSYGNTRNSETAIWNMDPSTFEITASWIDDSGNSVATYIQDRGFGGVYVVTDPNVSGPKNVLLTLIFSVAP